MRISKKILSLLMAIAMVVTMLPLGGIAALAEDRDHYLFAYFTSNSTAGQKIRFAVSEDGLNYNALNKNKAIINQTVGTGCARDPYIFIGQDGKYYIIATDMDATGGWWDNSNTIAVFQSDDLITWTNQELFNMYDMYTKMGISYVEGQTTVHCTWAPQVIWDSSVNKYMIYFALADTEISKSGKQIMYYMYATDLMDSSTWEAPQKLYEATQAAIDGDIIYDGNGTYYMYYKDESQATICYATANSLTGPYTYQGKAITSVSDALEGCNCFYRNGQLTMFCDAYNKGYFVAAESNDYQNWTVLNSSNYNIDQLSPRHGSVINITKSEYDALVEEFGMSTDEDVKYGFDRDYNTGCATGWDDVRNIEDSSGHTYTITRNWSARMDASTAHFSALDANLFVEDATVRSILSSKDWTISVDASVALSKGAPIISLTSNDGTMKDWVKLLDNGDIYIYNGSAEAKIGSITIKEDVEYSYSITYNGTTLCIYQDGKSVFTKEIGDVVGYSSTHGVNYLGVGFSDNAAKRFFGTFSNLRIRAGAITASQAASEAATLNRKLVYQYNEGTETVNGRDNTTSCGNGITTTYSGDYGTSYTVSAYVNVGAAINGESALFEFGNGGTNNSKQYLTLRENGTINFCWGDGSNPRYIDINGTNPFTVNKWHLVQLNIIQQGNYYIIRMYVDGNAVTRGNSDTGGTDPASGAGNSYDYNYSPLNLLKQSTTPLKLGTGTAYWGANASYIDDLRVYGKAVDPTVLKSRYEQDYRAESSGDDSGEIENADMDTALAIFEARIAKMANSGYDVMYTNINDAYTAYKAAVAAKNSGVAGADELANLKTALSEMTIFTPYTGTNNPGNGSTFNPESGYYGNIIYSEGGTNGTHAYSDNSCAEIYESHGLASRYGSWAYLYYPASVIMYDGEHDAVVPVMTGFRNKDGRYSVDVLALTEQMDDFGLKNGTWRTYGSYTSNDALDTSGGDSSTFQWPSGDSYAMPVTNTGDYMGDGYSMKTIQSGSNKENYYRTVKNGLVYTGTPTAAYTCYSQSTWIIRSHYSYISDHYINDTLTNGDPDIDIINYKKLIDALKAAANSTTNKGYLADLQEKYQSGGLEGLFKAYDSATTLDPNTGSTYFKHTYDYAGNGIYANEDEPMDVAALQCGNDIDASVALLGNIKITTESANYDRLVAAIGEYETKMANMKQTVYTNLTAAYKAYLLACEYRDAYEYGGRQTFENPTLSGAAEDLENATDAMIRFTDRTWNGKAAFNNNVITDDKAMAAGSNDNAGFNNVLYCSLATKWTDERDWNRAYNRLGIPNVAVLIVDGDKTPSLPCGFTHRKKNGNYGIYYVRMATTDFELRNYWKGYNNYNTEYHYNTSGYDGTAAGYEENYVYSTSSRSGQTHNNTSTARQWVNKFFYTGTGGSTSTGAVTDYYNTYNNMQFALATTRNNNYGSPWTNDNSVSAEKLGTVYTINYATLKNKLTTLSANINGIDVTAYQEGGLAAWLAKLDSVANVDPNSFFTNMNDGGVATAVTNCATAIKNACDVTVTDDLDVEATTDSKTNGDIYDSETGELNSISESNGAYTNLKIALEEIKSAPSEQGCVIDDYWDDYNDKLAAAQLAMYTIANNTGKDANTNKDGYANTGGAYTEAHINALATNLHNAKEALYDIANSAHPLMFSFEEREDHTGYFQCYANNSHVLDKDTHDTVTPAEMDAYDELGIVYSTLDLTKYNDRSGLNAGKTTYNKVKTDPGTAGQTAQSIVDDGTFALIEAINGATTQSGNVKTFNVTFNVNKNGEKVATNTSTYDYGTNVTLDAAALYTELGDHVCDSWEITINGKTKTIGNFANTMNIFVQSDVTVTANYVEKAAEGDKEIRLGTVTGRSLYELKGTTASTIKVKDVNTITVDGKDYRIPNTIVYSITGWKVGTYELTTGTEYTAADLEGYCYSSFLKLDPIVQKKYDDTTDLYDITLDGTAVYTDVKYDEIKSVTSEVEDVYALVIHDGDKFIPIAYAKDGKATYEFYVVYDMEIFSMVKKDGKYQVTMGNNTTTIDDETMLFFLDHKLPFVYSFTSADPARVDSQGICSKWIQNSAATMDGGNNDSNYKITEYGTLYTRPGTVLTSESMTIENVGSVQNLFKKVASNHHEFSNQWYYAMGLSSSNVGPVMFRSYVKFNYTYEYLDDNKNPQTRVVSAVAYGDLNTVYYNEADPSAS